MVLKMHVFGAGSDCVLVHDHRISTVLFSMLFPL
jgi:hypothetical protein